MDNEIVIGNTKLIETFNSSLARLTKGQGAIITVSGESGMGKSLLLSQLDSYATTDKTALWALARAANPIGKMKVGNLQPLLPFSKAIEILMEGPRKTAEKRFAINVGMTLLASIPGPDILFYAVKEIGKDWRQFKKERSSASTKKVSTAAADFYDAINAYCDKSPVVLLLDDMHWADAQSVELLSLFAENIASIPLLIVLSYKPSVLEDNVLPFMTFLNSSVEQDSVKQFPLEKFDNTAVSRAAKSILPDYVQNREFEEWIFSKSQGVPLTVVEYLKYFSTHSPFDESGKFDSAKVRQSSLPASIQSLISETMESLSEEDRNTLAVCSAEGLEFTISIVSKLLNLDVLTTIKKLRAIQNRTGIIRSLGASFKYGEKTTVYKFSQAYYHSYIEKTLEFEEYTALHGQISLVLKEKYEQTKFAEVRENLAPYIAAHSAEAGDKETAESMLLISAESAQKFGNPDVIKDLYEDYILLSQSNSNGENDNQNQEFKRILSKTSHDYDMALSGQSGSVSANGIVSGNGNGVFDFKLHLDNLAELFLEGKFDELISHTKDIKENYSDTLTDEEKLRLDMMQSKAYLEKGDKHTSKQILDRIEDAKEGIKDSELLCFYYNLRAVYEATEENFSSAKYYLGLAAQIAVELTPEMRLLTISNISIIFNEKSLPSAKKYYQTAKKLAYDLNMTNFLSDLEVSLAE